MLRKYLDWASLGVLTVGVAIYVAVRAGHVTGAVVFFAFATFLLGCVVRILVRAAVALVEEPAAGETAVASGRRRKELEREKQALLKALKELEFDHEMGKVSDRDFAEIGGQYRGRAVRVLRQLDEGGGEYEALIERELAQRLGLGLGKKRGQRAGEAKPNEAKASEAGPAASAEAKPAVDDGRPRCPACSAPNDLDAAFCKKCGAKLASTEAAS